MKEEVMALLAKAMDESDAAANEFECSGECANGDVPQGLVNFHRAIGRAQVAILRGMINVERARIFGVAE